MEVEEAVGLAIRAKLTPVLAPVPVYDRTPRNRQYPFVTFDRHIVEPDDDLSEQMSRHRITLTVWSDDRGPKLIREIIGKIRRTLKWANLDLAAGACVLCEIERSDVTEDQDGATYMGSVQIRVLTEDH
jgi:hypothetical protein